MNFRVIPSRQFLKTAKKYQRGGKRHILKAVQEVVDLLCVHDTTSLLILSERWRDHSLKGDKRDMRELHLSMDDLLLYRVDEGSGTIKLLDIVNHEELRRKK